MIEKSCNCCGKNMTVRKADVNRGWGKYCSKSCKAKSFNERRRSSIDIYGRDNRYFLASEHPFSTEALGQD